MYTRYYEVELLTGGMMRIGWATPTFPAGVPLGSDDKSYAYDGYLVSSKFAQTTHCQLSISLSLPPPLLSGSQVASYLGELWSALVCR